MVHQPPIKDSSDYLPNEIWSKSNFCNPNVLFIYNKMSACGCMCVEEGQQAMSINCISKHSLEADPA